MSPAKRKVAVSGRAGGKKRGLPKTRSKARAAARKTRGGNAACDMPVSRLAAAFDRPEGAAPLLMHVPGCGACTTSLTVLAASKQGLKHLTADGAGTAVERVLARGQAQGQKQLADLVYELVKACLVVVRDIDRRLHLAERPRSQDVIDRDMQSVAARLQPSDRRAVNGLPRSRPPEDRAMAVAGSCIAILEQIEGSSERVRLSRAVWLICSARPEEAARDLALGLNKPDFKRFRRHAYWNMLWALIRQDKASEALDWGERGLKEFPGDWLIAYNLVAASARSGTRPKFQRYASRLRLLNGQARKIHFEEPLLAFEVPRMAEDLSMSRSQIERALGISGNAERQVATSD